MADDIGKLVLRLTLGGLILLHGISKVKNGVEGMAGMLQAQGLPAALAYGVYVGEVLAALLVIVGFYARVGAGLIMVNMLFALALAHRDEILALTKSGGWAIELQAFYFFTALVIALIGPGRYSINRR